MVSTPRRCNAISTSLPSSPLPSSITRVAAGLRGVPRGLLYGVVMGVLAGNDGGKEGSGLGGRRLEHAVAGGALRFAGRQPGADAMHLRAQVVDNGLVLATGVPLHELGAELLQRTAAALVERVGLPGGLVEHGQRG